MKLKNRIIINISVIALLSVVVWQTAHRDIQDINDKFEHILNTTSQEVVALENVSKYVFRMQIEVMSYIAVSNSKGEDKMADNNTPTTENETNDFADSELSEFKEAQAEAEHWVLVYKAHYNYRLKKAEDNVRYRNPASRDSLVTAVFEKYKNECKAIFDIDRRSGNALEVRSKLKELESMEDDFVENINRVMEDDVAELQYEGASAKQIVADSKLKLGGICAAVLLISIMIGYAIAASIARPIEKLKLAAAAIGKGEYTKKVDIKRDDEIGELAIAFNQMVDDLAHAKILKAQKLQLEELNLALKKKNDALDSFVYRVSHDLKAPIINISSLLGLMKKKIAEDDLFSKQTVGFMEGSILQLQATIHDLLEVSRIERNLNLQADSLSFDVMFKELENNIQEQIRQANAIIETDFSLAPSLTFAKANLQSILANLVTNSLKYRSPERQCHIVIKSILKKDNLFLSVQDNGIGIDLERQGGKLFQMFSRLHDHVEGTGVGLYIVKKLVEDSGGKITVKSHKNVGTCFTIQFPFQTTTD